MKTLYLANLPEQSSVFALMNLSKENLSDLKEGLEQTVDNLAMSHDSLFGFPFVFENAFSLTPEMKQRGTNLYIELLQSRDILECINKEQELRYIESLGGQDLFKEPQDVILNAVENSFYEDSILHSLDSLPLRQAIANAVGPIRN